MNKTALISYLGTIADLCSNGNTDDSYIAAELSEMVLAHFRDGVELKNLNDVIEELGL